MMMILREVSDVFGVDGSVYEVCTVSVRLLAFSPSSPCMPASRAGSENAVKDRRIIEESLFVPNNPANFLDFGEETDSNLFVERGTAPAMRGIY